jgi:Secretion system C-terminal sorting domain
MEIAVVSYSLNLLMKLKLISALFFTALFACLFMGNSGGRASDARRGNTGAPGDETATCAGCHNTGDYQVTMKIELLENNKVIEAYEPEKTYVARTIITASGANVPKAYGFQLLSLIDKLGNNVNIDANGWLAKTESANTKIAVANNRSYAEHKAPSASNEFTISWKAPAKGTGNVTFYAAGNGVDGAGSSDRDNGTTTKLVLKEKITTSASDLALNTLEISLLQNPITDVLQVQLVAEKAENFQLKIFDAQGKMWYSEKIPSFLGTLKVNLSTETLAKGLYFLQMTNGKEQKAIKFLK